MADDVYDDPDNILSDENEEVDGPAQPVGEPTPFAPADEDEERESIDELDPDVSLSEDNDPDHPESMDPDDDKLGDVVPADERDDTEN